jgi:hypothetical protein
VDVADDPSVALGNEGRNVVPNLRFEKTRVGFLGMWTVSDAAELAARR